MRLREMEASMKHQGTALAVVLGAILGLAWTAALGQPAGSQIAIVDQLAVRYPARWVRSGEPLRNAQELLVPSLRPGAAPLAYTVITYERRTSAAEAVARLAAIAANVKAAHVTFLEIGGWPAMQRRYQAPLPRIQQKPVSEEERLALWTTTAIAVDSTVVRMDTTVFPGADPQLADEAEAAARTLLAPPPADPAVSAQEVLRLRQGDIPLPPRLTVPSPPPAPPAQTPQGVLPREGSAAIAPTNVLAAVNVGFGELEVAVSNDGQVVVVGSNTGVARSADAGATFPNPVFIPRGTFPPGNFLPFFDQGDPSTAVGAGALGNLYISYLGLPGATGPGVTPTSCAVTVMRSTDGGGTWTLAGNAASCPFTSASLCMPDQEHLAADRVNVTPSGDQLYVVWRHYTGGGANCQQITGTPVSSMACSTNGGVSWSPRIAVGAGDHPRVTVGPDGLAYVVQMDGDDVVVNKFTSCANGLAPVTNFPVTVVNLDLPSCPVPGLDRCKPEGLTSPMLAVDDTNASHVYAAYAVSTSSSNDNIIVADSTDGGQTWSDSVRVSANTPGRRFMP
jgi:hypothetical protein